MKFQITALAMFASLGLSGLAAAQTPPAANDYSKPETWLCLPGRAGDACTVDLATTVVEATGKSDKITLEATPAPAAIDCFYVYPTVSTDPTPNSDMTIDEAERRVVAVQFARFRNVCRPFAPMYRQVTLSALRQYMTGQNPGASRELAYNDVKDAWDWYLANENKGRGVVLIGHSQGSGVIQELVKREIDGKPIQKQIVGVMPIGSNVPVDDKGMFGSIPSCSAKGQTGCLISYVSFRAETPPPATSRFGKVAEDGKHAACINPAALGGGKGEPVSYHWNRPLTAGAPPTAWAKDLTVDTAYVTTPGLLTTECVRDGEFSYLKVTTNADPADARADTIPGDVVVFGKVDANWGLHLIDMNVAMGDLVEIVHLQAVAWKKSH
ncbi:DUF3089 domain-containing protein [Caulobacter sp. NIBR1757]|uniref:DUF3089 domain-containing protein n=1 Tax=Caulobacter sp. NIBR1757 TaxID=3016000 RepID=UPI0022F07A88|nr:DUF3089 domain-containing protein [Caulobacter sp. NIBR1757]WGM40330.1 hypothetical protein AMEJIAPC_03274 [Caulobacter sp. NIBR1757]